jgi:hypothetical protein
MLLRYLYGNPRSIASMNVILDTINLAEALHVHAKRQSRFYFNRHAIESFCLERELK